MAKRMTEQKYKAIKLMAKGGATLDEICEYYPIGKEILRRIKLTASFDEYRQLVNAYDSNKSVNKPVNKPEQLAIPVEIPSEQTEILRALLEKVSFLVYELTGKEA